MTDLAVPMATWGEKECSSVMKQALAAHGWRPRMPHVKVKPMPRSWQIKRMRRGG